MWKQAVSPIPAERDQASAPLQGFLGSGSPRSSVGSRPDLQIPAALRPIGLLGPGRGKIFFLVTLLICSWATACLIYLVHTRTQSIFLGYRIAHTRARLATLFEENQQLQIEARIWQTPERLQIAAARGMGLRPPVSHQVRFLPEVVPEGQNRPEVLGLGPSATPSSGLASLEPSVNPAASVPPRSGRP